MYSGHVDDSEWCDTFELKELGFDGWDGCKDCLTVNNLYDMEGESTYRRNQKEL